MGGSSTASCLHDVVAKLGRANLELTMGKRGEVHEEMANLYTNMLPDTVPCAPTIAAYQGQFLLCTFPLIKLFPSFCLDETPCQSGGVWMHLVCNKYA